MYHLKRMIFLGLIFVFLLFLSNAKTVQATSKDAEDKIISGKWYELDAADIQWQYIEKTETLTLRGERRMPDYDPSLSNFEFPW